MTRKKLRTIVRFSKRAHEHYKNDILTPLERRRKALAMANKGLSKEKIEEVQALIGTGATIAETAARTGVSKSSVCRIKSGKTGEKKPLPAPKPKQEKPSAPLAVLETAAEPLTQRELEALKALIGQAVRAFAGIECATAADSYNLGQTYGLLTAAQMILEGGEP